ARGRAGLHRRARCRTWRGAAPPRGIPDRQGRILARTPAAPAGLPHGGSPAGRAARNFAVRRAPARSPAGRRAAHARGATAPRGSAAAAWSRAQCFEFCRGLVELGDDFTVAPPGAADLVDLERRELVQSAPGALVGTLDALVAAFQPLESLP